MLEGIHGLTEVLCQNVARESYGKKATLRITDLERQLEAEMELKLVDIAGQGFQLSIS